MPTLGPPGVVDAGIAPLVVATTVLPAGADGNGTVVVVVDAGGAVVAGATTGDDAGR